MPLLFPSYRSGGRAEAHLTLFLGLLKKSSDDGTTRTNNQGRDKKLKDVTLRHRGSPKAVRDGRPVTTGAKAHN
ncbi:hypothetical protein T03_11752 [Trichinella britovi]|uniref:Uncharacterized protein n=1 Tax=Trichinella britovi TaxID=45882 RepID=A0A0V1C534_TRIBR|nr:hypothetical protein T03_11752 [Trichinella britovi]